MAVSLQILAEWYSYDIDLKAVHKLLDHCIMLNIIYTRNTAYSIGTHREGDAISTGCLYLSAELGVMCTYVMHYYILR